eukprot:gene9591-biopygen3774
MGRARGGSGGGRVVPAGKGADAIPAPWVMQFKGKEQKERCPRDHLSAEIRAAAARAAGAAMLRDRGAAAHRRAGCRNYCEMLRDIWHYSPLPLYSSSCNHRRALRGAPDGAGPGRQGAVPIEEVEELRGNFALQHHGGVNRHGEQDEVCHLHETVRRTAI